jgi:hypothetical protein
MERSYNTQIALGVPAEGKMDKFEEIGRRLDEELTRLRRYVEEEVAPETERRTAEFLREVSVKLTEAAAKLEARMAARRPPAPPSPQA